MDASLDDEDAASPYLTVNVNFDKERDEYLTQLPFVEGKCSLKNSRVLFSPGSLEKRNG